MENLAGVISREKWCAVVMVKYAESQERRGAKPPRVARLGSLGE